MMRNDVAETTIKQSFTNLIIGCILLWFGYEFGKSTNTRSYNPRNAIKNIDTIYYKDSIYKVRIYIDGVSFYEREYEQAERI